MNEYELFSKRQRREQGAIPDVYQYDSIPPKLRVQVLHIWSDTLGRSDSEYRNTAGKIYEEIHRYFCREYGCHSLVDIPYENAETRLRTFFESCSTGEALDIIEYSFRTIILGLQDHNTRYSLGPSVSAHDAVAELNERFKWHGVGYQFESGLIVKVDSQFLHSEVVKPALSLLAGKQYAGANAEFLTAFEHYRHGRTKECLTECLKAFESTMKAIFTKRGWTFDPSDTAKALIKISFDKELIPATLDSYFSGLRASLESGIPTIRNKYSGHGQGAKVVDVPPHFASFMLHQTAATIKFLIEADKDLP